MGFFSNFFKPVKRFFKGIGDFLGDIWNGLVGFVGDVFGGLFGSFNSPFDESSFNQTSDAGGILIQKYGSNNPIPVVYGYRRTGSTVIHAETNGENNKYLYVVYAIAEGEIHGINGIHIDGTQIPLSNNSNQIYTKEQEFNVTSGIYKDRARFQLFYGTDTQEQSSLANESKSWKESSNRKLPGLAYAVGRFEFVRATSADDAYDNPFKGGIPQINFDVLGKKVYNVITHGSGEDLSTTYGNLTKAFSYNPVNCLLDYLLNPRYGCGFAITDINADTFKTAAIKCNQQVTYSDTAAGQSEQKGKIFTCNAVIDTNAKLFDNTKILLSGMRGFMPFTQGRFKLKIEDAGHSTDITSATITSTIDIDEDNIIGSLSMEGENKRTKYNKVVVKYVDPDLGFTEQEVTYAGDYTVNNTAFPLVYPPIYPDLNIDLGDDRVSDDEALVGEFKFPTISNRNIALDYARLIYKKSRQQQRISFQCTPNFIEVEPGDIIRVTNTVMAYSNKTFRVTEIQLTDEGTCKVVAVEHSAAFYPYVSGAEIIIPAPIYKPTEYILQPPIQQRRQVPVQVQPPEDPEDPQEPGSTGDPEPVDPPPVVPLPPVPVPGIDYKNFRDYPSGTKETALLYNSSGAGFSHANIIAPLNGIIRENSFWNGYLNVLISMPADTTIDRLRVYKYSIAQKGIKATQDIPLDHFGAGSTADRQTQPLLITGLDDDTYLVPRWVSAFNKEYIDASTGSYAAISYTGLDGSSKTGKGLEAALNNLLQSQDFNFDPRERKVSHNLG